VQRWGGPLGAQYALYELYALDAKYAVYASDAMYATGALCAVVIQTTGELNMCQQEKLVWAELLAIKIDAIEYWSILKTLTYYKRLDLDLSGSPGM